jgi:hypothetical protein
VIANMGKKQRRQRFQGVKAAAKPAAAAPAVPATKGVEVNAAGQAVIDPHAPKRA